MAGMRIGRLGAVVSGAALLAAAVAAQDEPSAMRGAALMESCRREEPQCGAYLQGVLDGLIVRRAVCDAPRYDRERLRQVYLRWAEAETYLRDQHMAAGAEEALTGAWPCPTPPRSAA